MPGFFNSHPSVRSLSAVAGLARRVMDRWSERPAPRAKRQTESFEALEERRLLFSITITQDNAFQVAPGIFQAPPVAFAYAIPYAISDVDIDDNEPDEIVFDFNGDDFNAGPVLNNTFLPGGNDSFLRVRRVFQNSTQDFRLVSEDPAAAPPTDFMFDINASTGDFWEFEIFPTDNVNDAPLVLNNLSFETGVGRSGDNIGLNPAAFRLVVFFDDQVLGTFTGAALAALLTPLPPDPNDPTDAEFFLITENNLLDDQGNPQKFTRLRFEAIANEDLFLDNVAVELPPGNFTGLVESRVFGAQLTFTGPLGATVTVTDLYGRDMVATLRSIAPGNSNVAPIDSDDNGVPDYNDGIGLISISGADSNTSISMTGGTIEWSEQINEGITISEPAFGGFYQYTRVDSLMGLFDEFEDAGFGYGWEFVDDTLNMTGLPPGPGSVIIGAPTGVLRPIDGTPAQYLSSNATSILTDGFSNPTQGVRVVGSMGAVNIHGVVHGVSTFTGSLERWNVGYQVGSVSIEGDLGTFSVGSEAGIWSLDDDFAPQNIILERSKYFRTDAELIVGRSAREIMIAGRSLMDVTVIGDLSRPGTRPAREIFEFTESETITNIPVPADDYELGVMARFQNSYHVALTGNPDIDRARLGFSGPMVLFGPELIRNDSILGAEWIGSLSGATRVTGDLGRADPNHSDDGVDVFAFGSDGVTPIEVDLSIASAAQIRIVDKDGRTLAGTQAPGNEALQESIFLRYQPEAPGVYFVVVQGTGLPQATNNQNTPVTYSFIISGMQPAMLGSYRSGAHSGAYADNFFEVPANTTHSITVVNGGMGLFRSGTGYISPDGEVSEPFDILNNPNDDDIDQILTLGGMTIEIDGDLNGFLIGSDIEGSFEFPVSLRVGGDIGLFATGLSPLADDGGFTGVEGDVLFTTVDIGGRAGMFDIRGSIGVDEDSEGRNVSPGLFLTTGSAGVDGGDIGMFRVGGHIYAPGFSLTAPANTTIGAFLVTQDFEDLGAAGELGGDPRIGIFGLSQALPSLNINLGPGSDVRFTDFILINAPGLVDRTTELRGGTPIQFVDDGGARYTVSVQGASQNDLVGRIRFIPISGSEGVALGQIDNLDLSGGRRLQIRSLDNPTGAQTAPISIGRILIADADEQSTIEITGSVQVDVYRIDQLGGEAFRLIRNATPNGDIVAIDVVGLTELDIQGGSLGRTELPAYGPSEIGPFLGIEQGLVGDVLGAIGIPAETMTQGWNSGEYRPINDIDQANGYLDDVGSPVRPYLNGMIVREGNLRTVNVAGALGDVILQGAEAEIETIRINTDGTAPLGRFDGLIGSVMAQIIDTINVGMGIAALDSSPFARAGVFAHDELRTLRATDAVVGGVISATNIDVSNSGQIGQITFGPEVGGINLIDLTRSTLLSAFISTTTHDFFWRTISTNLDNEISARGVLNRLRGVDSDIFRSEIFVARIVDAQLVNGFYDATVTNVTLDVDLFRAAGFRNSTLAGSDLEFRESAFFVLQNVGRIETFGLNGDFSDITIDVAGNVTGAISGRNISRTAINVNNRAGSLITSGNLVASRIVVGSYPQIQIAGSLRTSEMFISGPLELLNVGGEIFNTAINITGSEGRIDRITVVRDISGSISSTGPIGTIETTVGDLGGFISTTRPSATVGTLRAARDLTASTDLAAGVTRLLAGRNIGTVSQPGLITVRGALNEATAAGQLHSDIVVGRTVQQFRLGAVSNLPGQNLVGRGVLSAADRIVEVSLVGDFGGGIISYAGGIGSFTMTNGSLLPGRGVTANAGSIDNFIINGGNLYANVHTDHSLRVMRILPSTDGVFGDIGISPFLSASVPSSDPLRNQLPPGVSISTAVDGPRITAGWNIGILRVEGGSMYEAVIHAGRAVGAVFVAENIQGDGLTPRPSTTIAARDSIFSVSTGGYIAGAGIIAGVRSFGANGLPGGTGVNADTVNSGFIETVQVGTSIYNSIITAGMDAGPDGIYNTGDELTNIGVSFVRNLIVPGDVVNTSVFSKVVPFEATANGRVTVGGVNAPFADPDIAPAFVGTELTAGVPLNFSTAAGSGNILFTGPGRVFFDSATSRVIFGQGSNFDTSIIVNTTSGPLTDFSVVSIANGSAGTIRVNASLLGNSKIVADAFVMNIITGYFAGEAIRVGQHTGPISTGPFVKGSISAKNAAFVTIGGDLGNLVDPDPEPEDIAPGLVPTVDILGSGFFTVNGSVRAIINAQRVVTNFNISGAVDNARIRAGDAIGNFRAGSISESRVSSGGFLTNIEIAGNVVDSQLLIGTDLGDNAEFDIAPTSEFNTDVVGAGFNETVTIGGSLIRSDIAAGTNRGPDRFFGTGDDRFSAGRSILGRVSIGGDIIGSNRETESFRIVSSGSLGQVTTRGQAAQLTGNARVVTPDLVPVPIRVTDLRIQQVSQTYFARITFNQPMDSSSFEQALTISEIRAPDNTLIRLEPGQDYTLSYNPTTFTLSARFSRAITERDLPQLVSLPGPGVYRFDLSQELLRAAIEGARLDGNADGVVQENDNFSRNDIVGDAGDKLPGAAGTINVTGPTGISGEVDFYGPINLNTVLDNNFAPDGLPQTNERFVIRGTIGDHPDHDARFFDFRSDVDVYTITLLAGQILQLEATTGAAFLTPVILFNPDGSPTAEFPFQSAFSVSLPGQAVGSDLAVGLNRNYLITQTGTYTLVVGAGVGFVGQPVIPQVPTGQNILGSYSIGLTVFDDGNTGFSAATDSGNGQILPLAPINTEFAGVDGVFGTDDDRSAINVAGYVFRLDPGLDGIPGTADDIVRGVNSDGDTVVREGGIVTTRVRDAIGLPGAVGIPSQISPDVDIFHINGRTPIQQGTRIRVTVELADFGADLGSRSVTNDFIDFSSNVQFAIFDTTSSTTISDGLLLHSPSAFSPNGGEPGVIASGTNATYGFNSNGDFFIEFVAGPRLDGAVGNPTYAVYIQGAFNTDYAIEVVTTPANEPVIRRRQNVFIETQGGSVDWLEVGGLTTQLSPFTVATIGFTGETADNFELDTFLVNQVLNRTQAIFDRAGLDVVVSTNPRDFEFQPFSTIFLTSTADPLSSLGGFTQEFGASQGVDPGNANRNDEAAVFIPSFALLGYTPSTQGIENLANSLTAAVTRRIGELIGLQSTAPVGASASIDVMAANSVVVVPEEGQVYNLINANRQLTNAADSIVIADFFLGQQNPLGLARFNIRDL